MLEKEDKLALSTKRQEVIALKKEELQSTIAKGKQKVHTRIWKVFEESYKLDLQVAIDFALIIVCNLAKHACRPLAYTSDHTMHREQILGKGVNISY